MEKKANPLAVVISPEDDESDWAIIERLQERNATADLEQVLADATAAVEEVRQEMYAESTRHRAAGGC